MVIQENAPEKREEYPFKGKMTQSGL